jgi:hypothetical protein
MNEQLKIRHKLTELRLRLLLYRLDIQKYQFKKLNNLRIKIQKVYKSFNVKMKKKTKLHLKLLAYNLYFYVI